MSKDDLHHGPLGPNCLHVCVDMQLLFAETTDWHLPWLSKVLPNIVEISSKKPDRTLFTRFIPAREAGHGVGMWHSYYKRWSSMTIEQLGSERIELVPELAKLVPPARMFDKYVYSPWIGSTLHVDLRSEHVDTLIVSGGETDVCVLATALGAIDWGFRTILVTDTLCSSSDQAHDALMQFYEGRLGHQLETASTETILGLWR